MFEKFAEDVMIRYQQKMAELVKMAEEDNKEKSQTYSNNLRNMSPEDAGDAISFERNVVGPLLRDDMREPDLSKVTGRFRGIPERAGETALEMAAGMGLPVPGKPAESTSLAQQLKNLESDFNYGKGFADAINYSKHTPQFLSTQLRDPNTGRVLPNQSYHNPSYDINDALRQQGNFYPSEWQTPDLDKYYDIKIRR